MNKEKRNIGLGLSISYILSKRLGRELKVNSILGVGTTIDCKFQDHTEYEQSQSSQNIISSSSPSSSSLD